MILKHSRIFSLIIILLSAQLSWAVDTSYYSSLDGTSGTTLWSAVHTVAKTGYSSLSYSGLWTAYGTTDLYPAGHEKAGKIWDLYSYCTSYTLGTDQDSGSGSTEGTVYNREHSIPKSWFGGSTSNNTPGTDIFHVYPTDKIVNGKRSNYALGEVTAANATYSSNKGCGGYSSSDLAGYSRLGTGSSITISNTIIASGSTTQAPTSSPVFEPLAEYKGDLARSYFGTMLRWAGDYAAFTTDDGSSMFSGTYTAAGKWGLTSYGVALLMKWHREDPVSQKEIDRNNAIQSTQGNRNPFIDYPILAEYFWGKYSGNTFNRSNAVPSFDTSNFTPGVSDGDKNSTDPTLTVSSSSITISPIATSSSTTQTFTVTGANLTGSISIAKSGSSYITVSPTSIPASSANGANTITITYNAPSSAGSHNATLTISSTGAESVTVTINASCATPKTITWNVDGSEYTTGAPTTSVGSGGNVTKLPTAPTVGPSGCTSKVFVGWSETNIGTTPQDDAPSDIFTSTSATACQNITSDKTFYAIFATETTSGSGARSLSKATSISEGDSVVFVCEDASYELTSFSTSSTIYGVGTSYSGTPAGTFGFKVVAGYSSGTYAFQSGSNYLYWTTGNSLTTNSTLSANTSWNVSISSGNATITNSNTSTRQIVWNVGSPRFATYNSPSIGSSYYNIQLYKISGGSSTTYSNYSTQCSEGTKVTITFHANGGEGTMAAQQVPQSTSRNLNTCTFTRTHYTFNGWNTQANGSGTSYADGASINTSTDLTLYAQWTEASQYTVTFKNNGVVYATEENYAGENITCLTSNPTACEGYTFEGWSTVTQATEATSKPSTTTPTTIPAENTTYHAVYSRTESSGDPVATNNYKKITSKSELTDGNYLIVANNSEAYNAMSTTFKNTYYLEGSSVTPDDDIITTTMANIIWQINVSDDQATIYNATFHYLYIESSTSGTKTYYNIKLGDNTTNNKFSYEVSNGEWIFTSATYTDRQIEYYTTNTRWAYHTSQDAPVYLYKQQYEASSTTYYTTSPNCCKATLTVQSPDDTMGTVSIE